MQRSDFSTPGWLGFPRQHVLLSAERRDLPGSWSTLAHVPRSQIPESSTRRPRRTVPHYASTWPSTWTNASALSTSILSGFNLAAHLPAVYASWSRSPVYFSTTTQDSLPARAGLCSSRSGLPPVGRTRSSGSLLLPSIRLGLAPWPQTSQRY